MSFDAYVTVDSVTSHGLHICVYFFMFLFFLDEKADVAMAVLPFLLKPAAKEGLSQQQDFVYLIPVSK